MCLRHLDEQAGHTSDRDVFHLISPVTGGCWVPYLPSRREGRAIRSRRWVLVIRSLFLQSSSLTDAIEHITVFLDVH